MNRFWVITKRSDHGQYFRGLAGIGSASSPVTAEWTPYRSGGVRFECAKDAFLDAFDIWGATWREAVRVVRVTRRGKQ